MKKIRALMSLLAICTLSGCDFFNKKDSGGDGDSQPSGKTYKYTPDVVGGGADEKEAIYNALNKKPICNQYGSKTNEIFPENRPVLSEDEGDGVKLSTSQVVKVSQKNFTVNITWDIPEQTYFKALLDSDSAHKIIEVAYQGYGVDNGELTWTLKKMECNGAYAEPNLQYTAYCKNEEFYHEDYSIAQIYAFHDYRPGKQSYTHSGTTHYFPSTWDTVDYEPDPEKSTYSPYFKTNNPEATEKQYLYLNVLGKVIYLAPDGNWGLFANGDNVLEIYIGGGTKKLNTTYWPNLANEYVKISGNMGQYCGNIQFGFITKISEVTTEERAQIQEPTMNFRELTETKLASLNVDGFTSQIQACKIDDVVLDGSLRQVTGTLVNDSIKMKNGDNMEPATADSINSSRRITFDLKVGEQIITVAYDYHADSDRSAGLFNEMQTALKKGAGTSITVKGTMRYSGNDSSPFVYEGNHGVWNIVPFKAGHVSA